MPRTTDLQLLSTGPSNISVWWQGRETSMAMTKHYSTDASPPCLRVPSERGSCCLCAARIIRPASCLPRPAAVPPLQWNRNMLRVPLPLSAPLIPSSKLVGHWCTISMKNPGEWQGTAAILLRPALVVVCVLPKLHRESLSKISTAFPLLVSQPTTVRVFASAS